MQPVSDCPLAGFCFDATACWAAHGNKLRIFTLEPGVHHHGSEPSHTVKCLGHPEQKFQVRSVQEVHAGGQNILLVLFSPSNQVSTHTHHSQIHAVELGSGEVLTKWINLPREAHQLVVIQPVLIIDGEVSPAAVAVALGNNVRRLDLEEGLRAGLACHRSAEYANLPLEINAGGSLTEIILVTGEGDVTAMTSFLTDSGRQSKVAVGWAKGRVQVVHMAGPAGGSPTYHSGVVPRQLVHQPMPRHLAFRDQACLWLGTDSAVQLLILKAQGGTLELVDRATQDCTLFGPSPITTCSIQTSCGNPVELVSMVTRGGHVRSVRTLRVRELLDGGNKVPKPDATIPGHCCSQAVTEDVLGAVWVDPSTVSVFEDGLRKHGTPARDLHVAMQVHVLGCDGPARLVHPAVHLVESDVHRVARQLRAEGPMVFQPTRENSRLDKLARELVHDLEARLIIPGSGPWFVGDRAHHEPLGGREEGQRRQLYVLLQAALMLDLTPMLCRYITLWQEDKGAWALQKLRAIRDWVAGVIHKISRETGQANTSHPGPQGRERNLRPWLGHAENLRAVAAALLDRLIASVQKIDDPNVRGVQAERSAGALDSWRNTLAKVEEQVCILRLLLFWEDNLSADGRDYAVPAQNLWAGLVRRRQEERRAYEAQWPEDMRAGSARPADAMTDDADEPPAGDLLLWSQLAGPDSGLAAAGPQQVVELLQNAANSSTGFAGTLQELWQQRPAAVLYSLLDLAVLQLQARPAIPDELPGLEYRPPGLPPAHDSPKAQVAAARSLRDRFCADLRLDQAVGDRAWLAWLLDRGLPAHLQEALRVIQIRHVGLSALLSTDMPLYLAVMRGFVERLEASAVMAASALQMVTPPPLSSIADGMREKLERDLLELRVASLLASGQWQRALVLQRREQASAGQDAGNKLGARPVALIFRYLLGSGMLEELVSLVLNRYEENCLIDLLWREVEQGRQPGAHTDLLVCYHLKRNRVALACAVHQEANEYLDPNDLEELQSTKRRKLLLESFIPLLSQHDLKDLQAKNSDRFKEASRMLPCPADPSLPPAKVEFEGMAADGPDWDMLAGDQPDTRPGKAVRFGATPGDAGLEGHKRRFAPTPYHPAKPWDDADEQAGAPLTGPRQLGLDDEGASPLKRGRGGTLWATPHGQGFTPRRPPLGTATPGSSGDAMDTDYWDADSGPGSMGPPPPRSSIGTPYQQRSVFGTPRTPFDATPARQDPLSSIGAPTPNSGVRDVRLDMNEDYTPSRSGSSRPAQPRFSSAFLGSPA